MFALMQSVPDITILQAVLHTDGAQANSHALILHSCQTAILILGQKEAQGVSFWLNFNKQG